MPRNPEPVHNGQNPKHRIKKGKVFVIYGKAGKRTIKWLKRHCKPAVGSPEDIHNITVMWILRRRKNRNNK